MASRMILFEGAPGSGKSTAAGSLHKRMPGSNLYTEFGPENPIFGFDAFLKYLLEPCRIELEEPERSEVAAMPRLDAAQFQARTLRAIHLLTTTPVALSIVDGSFIGVPLLLLRLGYDLEADRVASFIRSMFDAARPLEPALAMLMKPSVDLVMAEIDHGRPQHGDWVARLIAGSPHGRRRGFEPTRDGLRPLLVELLELAEAIVDGLTIPRMTFCSGLEVWRRGTELEERIYAWAGAVTGS